MIELTPNHCDFREDIFELADSFSCGVEAIIKDQWIVNEQANINIRGTLIEFHDKTDDAIAIKWPQLTELSIAKNLEILGTENHLSFDKNDYIDKPTQAPHIDNTGGFPTAHYLEDARDYVNVVVPYHFYEKGLIPPIQNFSRPGENQNQTLKYFYKYLLDNKLAFIVSDERGLIFLTNDGSRASHGRNRKEFRPVISNTPQGVLHCFDIRYFGKQNFDTSKFHL